MCAALALLLLPACSWMPWRHSDKAGKPNSCNKPQPYEQAQGVPPLRVPVGLDAPNTRSALKIPELREPEAPRQLSDPCLDEPPKYSNAQLMPPPKEAKKGKQQKPKQAAPAAPAAAPSAPAAPAPAAPAAPST